MSTLNVDNISPAHGTDTDLNLSGKGSGTVSMPSTAKAGDKVILDEIKSALDSASSIVGSYKNAIINGDFKIWQRGSTHSNVSGNTYFADRFCYLHGGGSQVVQLSQGTDMNSAPTNMKLEVTTASGTLSNGQGSAIVQRFAENTISHWNIAKSTAKKITISFVVKSSVPGTYCVSLFILPGFRTHVSEYTIDQANTEEKKSVTIQLPIDGEYVERNTYELAAGLIFNLGNSGSGNYVVDGPGWQSSNSYLGTVNQVNLLSTIGNTFEITNVQVEVGNTATNFEYLPFDEQLERCLPYFEVSYNYGTPVASVTNKGMVYIGYYGAYMGGIIWRKPKIKTPNFYYYSHKGSLSKATYRTSSNTDASYDYEHSNSVGIWSSSEKSITLTLTGSGTGSYFIHYMAEAEL